MFRQFQTTRGQFVNGTANRQSQLPGGQFLDDEAGPVLVQYFPNSDKAVGTWTTQPGSQPKYLVIGESVRDDSSYDQSAVDPVADVLEVGIACQTPISNVNHTISYVIKGDGATPFQVDLVCATTIIKTWTHNPAPNGFTRYDQKLSTAEADSIANYADLRLRSTAG